MIGIKKHIDLGNMGIGKLLNKKSKGKKKVNKKKETTKERSGDNTDEKSPCIDSRKMYYPPLVNESPVKNDIIVEKDSIITGPNAAGKTTMIKSVLINILLTQQFGHGFYESMKFYPYTHLHCYLNVPDTCGRDSLFQSESRKCKDILEEITASETTSSHFVLFDELYSGTNPSEAVKCGCAYLKYLSSIKNVDYMLTTHYTEVCEKLGKENQTTNYKMVVTENKDKTLVYSYKIAYGINRIDGGVEVLKQLEYPQEIIDNLV